MGSQLQNWWHRTCGSQLRRASAWRRYLAFVQDMNKTEECKTLSFQLAQCYSAPHPKHSCNPYATPLDTVPKLPPHPLISRHHLNNGSATFCRLDRRENNYHDGRIMANDRNYVELQTFAGILVRFDVEPRKLDCDRLGIRSGGQAHANSNPKQLWDDIRNIV